MNRADSKQYETLSNGYTLADLLKLHMEGQQTFERALVLERDCSSNDSRVKHYNQRRLRHGYTKSS